MKKYYTQLSKKQKKVLWLWQVMLILLLSIFIGGTTYFLHSDKKQEELSWGKYLYENPNLTPDEKITAKHATEILTGVYVENINDVDIKNSSYTVTFQVWFRWHGNLSMNMLENYEIYKGHIETQEVLADHIVNGERYQLARVKVTVAKTFGTARFPLGSYQLRFYLEPKPSISEVILQADPQSFINKNINISGFNVRQFGTNIFIQEYENNKSNPLMPVGSSEVRTEFLTAIELNRENIGLYIRCFIALVGTLGWVLIVLFICTFHNVEPLSMLPGDFLGQ